MSDVEAIVKQSWFGADGKGWSDMNAWLKSVGDECYAAGRIAGMREAAKVAVSDRRTWDGRTNPGGKLGAAWSAHTAKLIAEHLTTVADRIESEAGHD